MWIFHSNQDVVAAKGFKFISKNKHEIHIVCLNSIYYYLYLVLRLTRAAQRVLDEIGPHTVLDITVDHDLFNAQTQ